MTVGIAHGFDAGIGVALKHRLHHAFEFLGGGELPVFSDKLQVANVDRAEFGIIAFEVHG
jgi:hypothetical protein